MNDAAALAKAQARVAAKRKQFHHETAKSLLETYDAVAVEDLNVKGLARGMLAKWVHDAAWSQFLTILENNAMQSIATSAGYMTVPLMSSFAAYFWKANVVLPWYQLLAFNIVTAVMGVLVAFPMKRRFINDEQQPFPEGRACGVVLDTLYTGKGAIGKVDGKTVVLGNANYLASVGIDANPLQAESERLRGVGPRKACECARAV